LGKDLRKVKKILKFLFLPFGYLRVWATRLRSSNYGVTGKLTTKARKREEFLATCRDVCSPR
jgi:hypothetical protein